MNITCKPNHELHQAHLTAALGALSCIMSWLIRGQDDVSLDDNVQTSLEGTAIRAANRLDKLLDEDSRWDLPPYDSHAMAAQHVALTIEAQRMGVEDLQRVRAGQAKVVQDFLDGQARNLKPKKGKK